MLIMVLSYRRIRVCDSVDDGRAANRVMNNVVDFELLTLLKKKKGPYFDRQIWCLYMP